MGSVGMKCVGAAAGEYNAVEEYGEEGFGVTVVEGKDEDGLGEGVHDGADFGLA